MTDEELLRLRRHVLAYERNLADARRNFWRRLVWLHEHDGIPVPTLAEWLGVSRQQVYRLMRER